MLYYLFEYLDKTLGIPGTGVFQYITFRSGLAVLLSLMISMIYGKRVISFLRNQQVGVFFFQLDQSQILQTNNLEVLSMQERYFQLHWIQCSLLIHLIFVMNFEIELLPENKLI